MIAEDFELRKLAFDLSGSGVKAAIAVRQIVLKGAVNVQKEARQLASGHRALGAYPFSITFDVDSDGLGAEIGPDKEKRQGALGNIVEYGTSKNAPMPHLGPALEHEAPKFEQAIAEAATRVVVL